MENIVKVFNSLGKRRLFLISFIADEFLRFDFIALFRQLCVQTFLELRRHYQRILLYLETISKGNEHLACFNHHPQAVIQEVCDRFYPQMNDHAAEHMIHRLIHQSLDHWTTNAYDQYQRLCQGIF